MAEHDLRIGGLAPLSTCDWPGELAATVFCQGCGWDCAYCHNPELISPQGEESLPWAGVLAFLESRRGLLDGVVFSGGEPLLQPALPDAISAVRRLGFRVALHTNGQLPERLAAVLPLLDWVGIDAKAPFEPGDVYERITGVADSAERARRSLELIVSSGVGSEVRTTVHSALLGEPDLELLAAQLREAGVRRWAVQAYRADGARKGLLPGCLPLEPGLLGRLACDFEEFEFRG